jgi:hypothetical protein
MPRRTSTSSSTSLGAPTARVSGPTRATAKSGWRSQTGKPLAQITGVLRVQEMDRFWKVLSSLIARMVLGRPRRDSTRLNSRVSPVSFVVSARVTRTASRDRFNPGTDAAAPINPGQSFGWPLGQRLARFARSNWSALIDTMVSVSCGSHSRPRGD